MVDILEDIRAEFGAADINLSSRIETKDIERGDTDSQKDWALSDTPQVTEPSFPVLDDTFATSTHRSDLTEGSLSPQRLDSSTDTTSPQDRGSKMDQHPYPQNLSHVANVAKKGRPETMIVWFCSVCGDGPNGTWRDVCPICDHVSCYDCKREET
jgi:hypothetical protein